MKMRRSILIQAALVTATATCTGFAALGWRQDAPPAPPAGFPDLVGGLKATPGCLGVETARTESGRNMIFAWFKDKKSVQRWYYSETHQGVIDLAVDEYDHTKPLAHVPDDAGPIMVIASLVMADKPHLDGLNLPISEISIELYETLPGGVFLGGRFAPKDVKIEHMRDYTSPAAADGS